ncbi:MAG: flagellar biosynthesis protein FlhF [Comamonas sp.]
MKILKFTGATNRDVLNQVRANLGEDALIISSRRNDAGLIEILAADPASVTPPGSPAAPAAAPAAPAVPAPDPAPTPTPASATSATQARPNPPAATPPAVSVPVPVPENVPAPTPSAAAPAPVPPPAATQPAAAPAAPADIALALSSLQGELARRFDGLMWGSALKRSPQRTALLRELLEAGFSTTLARELLGAAPDDLDAHGMRQWLRDALVIRLRTPGPEAGQEMLARPGTYALIGPTGVGKTTTVAKLAARCIELHGRGSLALVTTDSYRVAAHEQLQTFGRIMGVPVYPMRSDADLRSLLQRLDDKAVVLIDNIGLSQRDGNVSRQLALLGQAGLPVRRVLVLNAASQGDTLDEVARIYGSTAQAEGDSATPLLGCIVTKLDEAARTGSVLDTAIRHGLAVHYVSDGQKVPENLRPAMAEELIDRALAPESTATALYVPDEADLAALVEAAARPAAAPAKTASNLSPGAGEARRTWLPWLLHRAGNGAAEQTLASFDRGLGWARRDSATRLAHEAWRHWSQQASGGQTAPHLLADQWSKAAQQAGLDHGSALLAVHGKASLAPQLPRAALSGAILASVHGEVLCTPAQALTSQFGHYSIADQGDEPHELPLRRLHWLERELPRLRRIHLFDSVAASQWSALQRSGAEWLAQATGALKACALDRAGPADSADSTDATPPSARAEALKALAAEVVLTPLEADPSAPTDEDGDPWWVGERTVSLRTSAGSAAGATPAEGAGLRLLVLRRATARPGSPETAIHLLLSNIGTEQASAARLAHHFLMGQRVRQAFRYMAPAWYALGHGPEENGVWLRRALVAGQIGAAAWQATQAGSAVPMRGLLTAASGWQPQASARATVEALLRAFALMELVK